MKMQSRSVAVLITSAYLVGWGMSPPLWSQSFTADVTAEMLGHEMVGKVYVTSSHYRTELQPKERQGDHRSVIVIVNRQQGRTLLLIPQAQRCDDIESFTPRAFMADPFQSIAHLERIAQKKTVGAEPIDGFACTHEAFYDKDFKLADAWFASDLGRFPVKMCLVSGRRDGNVQAQSPLGNTRLELSNIQRKPIDPALFAVPEGYARTTSPASASGAPSVPGQFKGTAPWGRRLGKGHSMQLVVDPQRPVTIKLRNLADASSGTYTAAGQATSANPPEPQSFMLAKKGQRKTVSFSKNKKIRQISIGVDKGLVYAVVSNEKDPFASDADGKLLDGYLIAKEGQGFSVDPARKLIITVIGDSQDTPTSEVTVLCYQKQYQNKVFEKSLRLANGKTQTWEFTPAQKIRTCEVLLKKTGGVKFRFAQPPLAKPEPSRPQTGATTGTGGTGPRVVRTTPITPQGSAPKTAVKKTIRALTKEETSIVLKALSSGDVATVRALLDKGIDPDVPIYGLPLLQKAANISSPEMVKMIVARGGNLTYKDRSGNDVLTRAQSNTKHWQAIIPVLLEAGIEVNRDTPIWKIAFKTQNGKFKPGVKETLEALLAKGANVNTPISKTGNTLLMFAAKMAWLEPVQFYLDHGADVHAKDKEGRTALSWAKTEKRGESLILQQNRKAIVELLESKGAK